MTKKEEIKKIDKEIKTLTKFGNGIFCTPMTDELLRETDKKIGELKTERQKLLFEEKLNNYNKKENKKRIEEYESCIKEDKEEIKELKKVKLMMFESPLTLIKQRKKRIKKALYFIKKLESNLKLA